MLFAERVAAMTTNRGPYRVGEPEDESDGVWVMDASGAAMTADEIVSALNAAAPSIPTERDAQRYRWLRDSLSNVGSESCIQTNEILLDADEMTHEQFDAAIDAAMGVSGEQNAATHSEAGIAESQAPSIRDGDRGVAPTSSAPSAAPVHRPVEYDGAYKCIDCGAMWGALPGHPNEPKTCNVAAPAVEAPHMPFVKCASSACYAYPVKTELAQDAMGNPSSPTFDARSSAMTGKYVPLIPTEEMLVAANTAYNAWAAQGGVSMYASLYAAMLAAAPSVQELKASMPKTQELRDTYDCCTAAV